MAAHAAQEGRVDDRLTDADPAMASPASRPIASSVHAVAAPAHPKGSAKVAKVRMPRPPKPLANYKWARKQPFNPRSHDQTIALIKALGLKPPRSRDDEDSETAQAKHLRKFGMKHRVFMDILRYRQRMTMLSNYDWQVDANKRIHTQYGWHPSTWRKSSRSYNLQTIPKRNELADAFRQQIEAADGCYLIEADSSAIEAVLVGYDAGSPGYIKLAKAGLHGWMTAAYHKEPIPIDAPDLAKRCKAAKKRWPVDYEVLKRVNHLSNYLGTPEKIYEEYPEEFTSVAMAADMQRFIFSTGPGQEVRRWQRATMDKAHQQCYLLNHWLYKHYFYEVYSWNWKRRDWDLGEDAKRAVAFGPQSDGSAFQTDVLLRLAANERMAEWLRLIIHDSIVIEVPEDSVEWAAQQLYDEMTRPVPELNGLVIGAELKYGRNLGAMGDSNPAGMQEIAIEVTA